MKWKNLFYTVNKTVKKKLIATMKAFKWNDNNGKKGKLFINSSDIYKINVHYKTLKLWTNKEFKCLACLRNYQNI